MSKISVKLLENDSTINKQILEAMLPEVKKYFSKIENDMKNKIPDIVINSIMAQPEYSSLMGGELQYEFGIPDPANRLSEILNAIRNTQSIRTVPPYVAGFQIKGNIKFQMIQNDFDDLISLGGATLTTEKGAKLNWLEWLLLEGDRIIISDYSFVLGPSPFSRTGGGIMKKNNGGSWRVPPEFAGSANNNWITRALNASQDAVETEIMKIGRI